MKEKKCTKCGEVNNESYSYCKKCNSLTSNSYMRTKRGLFIRIHGNQVLNSKSRNHPPPDYTMKELRDWGMLNPKYHKLHKEWVNSGYNKSLVPSFDRIDDYKPYTLDNLQLTTWKLHIKKSSLNVKNGITRKRLKSVFGIHIKTGKKTWYYSMAEAERQTGVDHSGISKCCLGKKESAGGYIWIYNILQ